MEIEASDLIQKIGPMEERLYRHRVWKHGRWLCLGQACLLQRLVKLADPKPEAKYLVMETFLDPAVARGQKQPCGIRGLILKGCVLMKPQMSSPS